MRRRGEALAAVAAVAAIAVGIILVLSSGQTRRHRVARLPSAPPRPALPAPAGQVFGINVNRLFNDLTYTQAQIDAQLAAVRATGATVARSDALWEAAEPHAPVDGRHRYDWSFDDQIAGSLAAHGLTWLPIIDYTAPWAQSVSGQDHSPPRSDADYAAYAAAFAAALRGRRDVLARPPGPDPGPGDGDRDLERARQPGVLGARARRGRLRPALSARRVAPSTPPTRPSGCWSAG